MKRPASPRCSACGRGLDGEVETRPFCSPRCRDVELGNWFLDRYRVSRVLNPEEDLEEFQAALESDEEEGLAG